MKKKAWTHMFAWLTMGGILLCSVGVPFQGVKAAAAIAFTADELLGKPEDDSIVINIVPGTTIEYHYQYGTTPGSYENQTGNHIAAGGQPHEIRISGLTPNTHYYYRMQYHAPGEAMNDWVDRSEGSFWTQRPEGSTFSFTVTSDSHATFNLRHQNAMTNILNERPDFEIDLGDTFYIDGLTNQNDVNGSYLAYRDPVYMGRIGHSVPIFLASGNHEDEEGWNLDDTFSLAQASIQARKLYFPTPIEDGFYSGNTDSLAAIDAGMYGDQFREDYYAWTWGDALFVVIDEFQYSMNRPYSGSPGEGSDDPVTGDQWSWTLGSQQYQWLKQTLETSQSKYKFIFSHQMLGGIPNLTIAGVGPGYVRGGAGASTYFEWGGKNADGSEGFSDHRNPADFGMTPIHQLMAANGVSAYFHGHDHQYVYEKTDDGIVYQEVPSPSMTGSGFSGIYSEGDHGTFNTIEMLPNPGHLRVTVSPTQASVDYISSSSTLGTINYTYTIAPNTGGATHNLTTAASPATGGTVDPPTGSHPYAEGAVVPVSYAASSGYTFSGWSGDCSGSGACSVTMDSDKSVTANFTINTYSLTVNKNGTGSGVVTSSPPGINCGAVCSGSFDYATDVSLSSAASTGSSFGGWTGGGCTGTNECTVRMDEIKTVTAAFTLNDHILSISKDGTGSGTVSSYPGGINCGPTCSASFNYGTQVTLTAAGNSGSSFAGWSGANCAGTGICLVTMNTGTDVKATFTLVEYLVTTGVNGLGSIQRSSDGPYHYGEVVQLTALPAEGWNFTAWSGDVTGSANPANLLINANKTVTATFTQKIHTLTVSKAGNGSGLVSSMPAGISCGDTCSYDFAESTLVTLTAEPLGSSVFAGWSGSGCPMTGSCTLTMSTAKSVTAEFRYVWGIFLPLVSSPGP